MATINYIMGWYVIRKDSKIVFQTKSKSIAFDVLKKVTSRA